MSLNYKKVNFSNGYKDLPVYKAHFVVNNTAVLGGLSSPSHLTLVGSPIYPHTWLFHQPSHMALVGSSTNLHSRHLLTLPLTLTHDEIRSLADNMCWKYCSYKVFCPQYVIYLPIRVYCTVRSPKLDEGRPRRDYLDDASVQHPKSIQYTIS